MLTLTYFGGERIIPGYNVMGICKAALDACMNMPPLIWARAAFASTRSAPGPLKTLASAAVGAKDMETLYAATSRPWAAT